MKNYYITSGIDAQKIMDVAFKDSTGDSHTEPQHVVVHYHSYDKACLQVYKHKEFVPPIIEAELPNV